MKRDLVGYGANTPSQALPNQARVAVSFVINYEEGGERSPLYGDDSAETYGGEFPLSKKPKGLRSLSQESLFAYGARTGIWRLVRLFDTANIPLTFFVTGFALQQNPEFAEYLKNSRHEVAGHGWRWIDYSQVSKEEEKDHILLTQDTLSSLTEKNIRGWYTGRRSQHTRNLLKEIGHCVYDSDDYSDDYPYFEDKHLIIPYSLVTNDFRYLTTPGFSNPNDFYQLLKSSFDALYQEGRGAILNIGLHARVSGHPGRSIAINQFIEYLKTFSNIWITTREAIAHHWLSKR